MKDRAFKCVGFVISLLLAACSGGTGTGSLTPATSPQGQVTGSLLKPQDTLGGLPGMPPILDINLGDAAPRLGSLTPSAINLAISEVDAVSKGRIVPIAVYPLPRVVNVLALQNEPDSIGVGAVWTGSYQQIRFVVNVANSGVVADGVNYPIQWRETAANNPSADANIWTSTRTLRNGSVAITISGNFDINGEVANAIDADFNAFESLKVNENGKIVARPAMFAVPTMLSGKIAGSVLNAQGAPVSGATVVAFNADGQVANTDNTAADGSFGMHTLAAGSYRLVVYNTYRTTAGQAVNATNQSSSSNTVSGGFVTVTAGQTSNVPAVND